MSDKANYSVGDTARLFCQFDHDDREVKVTWLHDGQPLAVSNEDRYQLSGFNLVIEKLVKNDTGNYVCAVSTRQDRTESSPYELSISCESRLLNTCGRIAYIS
jgi:Immunoglobulin domain